MSKVIKLKKGLDIKLNGVAEKIVKSADPCTLYGVKPTDFRSLAPKLAVKIGDEVKAGDVLFYDKQRPEIQITSPTSGRVEAIVRGERRKLLEVVIKNEGAIEYRDFGVSQISSTSREEIISKMLESGVWPVVKQRPYDIIANPTSTPKAIFVSGFDTAPLSLDYELMLAGQEQNLQTGFDCLKKLAGSNVKLNLESSTASSSILAKMNNVDITFFEGPHPAGNPGIQIHHISPINKGEIVWCVNVQDVALIGRLFNEGRYEASKVIAIAGSEVKTPMYYRAISGAAIQSLTDSKLKGETHERIISGNVLTGTKVAVDSFLGFYDNQITVIPEGDHYEFLGWASPGFGKFSASRLFPAFLCSKKSYTLDANYHGERRAFVVSGQYEKVLPMDIYPVYLLKAILAKDIDKMEALGLYEIAPEDLALCEVVCTSKTPVQAIVSQGIELMMKELS